jgi:large subunit ribosomal protein L22
MITARLNNYRQSPRKVRVVANTIRGKKASEAINILSFLVKRASDPLNGLLASAIANAKNNFNLSPEGLFVKEIRVDGGVTLKRSLPKARGSASRMNKRTSHILITLAPIVEKAKEIKKTASKSTKIAKK